MDSNSNDTSSTTGDSATTVDLDILKQNPQLQQLLLMTLSAIQQRQQQQKDSTTKATLDNDKRKFDQLDIQSLPGEVASLSDQGSPGSDSSSEKILGRPGRRPLCEDEIKKSEMDPKSKRKAQNRAAQRAFRERRVNHVKELEMKIKALEENQNATTEKVIDENKRLKKIIQQLQVENAILGGTASSFDIPLSEQLSTANSTNDLSVNYAERPQKLLRSIGQNSNATLLSATTTSHQSYDSSSEPSSSFTASSHPGTTYSSSSSSSSSSSPTIISSNNQSFAPPDIYLGDVLSNLTLPTDILNTLDASQLTQSFSLDTNSTDSELLNTLIANSSESSPAKSTTKTNPSPAPPLLTSGSLSAATVTSSKANDVAVSDKTSDDWIESLLFVDDDDTDSSSSSAAAATATTTTTTTTTTTITATHTDSKHPPYSTDDYQSLPHVWDMLTEHPRFDEFDIDLLCEEMTRKAVCDDGTHCTNKSHQQKLKETIHRYYPNPSF